MEHQTYALPLLHRIAACGALLLASGWLTAGAQQATPSAYMGSESCSDCHAEISKSFATTPHWKTTLNTRRGAAFQGCESCHGP
jgi:hypothetical protein